MSDTTVFNSQLRVEGESHFKADVDFWQNAAVRFVLDGAPDGFPASGVVAQLFYYSGSNYQGPGIAEYRGGTGTDFAGLPNSAGWYYAGNYDDSMCVYIDGSRPFLQPQTGVDATDDLHLVTFRQLKSLVNGLTFSTARVRYDNASNIANWVQNPDPAVDDVAMVVGDIVLIDAYDGSNNPVVQNGLWKFNGANVPLTRVVLVTIATNPNKEYNAYPGRIIVITEGTDNADTLWLCVSDTSATAQLGVDAISFVNLNFNIINYEANSVSSGGLAVYKDTTTNANTKTFNFKGLKIETPVVAGAASIIKSFEAGATDITAILKRLSAGAGLVIDVNDNDLNIRLNPTTMTEVVTQQYTFNFPAVAINNASPSAPRSQTIDISSAVPVGRRSWISLTATCVVAGRIQQEHLSWNLNGDILTVYTVKNLTQNYYTITLRF